MRDVVSCYNPRMLPGTNTRVLFHGDETEHWRLRVRVRRHGIEGAKKMPLNTTDHQIGARVKKTHYFNTVLQEWGRCYGTTGVRLKAWILSPVYAVCRIIN